MRDYNQHDKVIIRRYGHEYVANVERVTANRVQVSFRYGNGADRCIWVDKREVSHHDAAKAADAGDAAVYYVPAVKVGDARFAVAGVKRIGEAIAAAEAVANGAEDARVRRIGDRESISIKVVY